jgi:hypothetical protein
MEVDDGREVRSEFVDWIGFGRLGLLFSFLSSISLFLSMAGELDNEKMKSEMCCL